MRQSLSPKFRFFLSELTRFWSEPETNWKVWKGFWSKLKRIFYKKVRKKANIEANLKRIWSKIETNLKWIWSEFETSLKGIWSKIWNESKRIRNEFEANLWIPQKRRASLLLQQICVNVSRLKTIEIKIK